MSHLPLKKRALNDGGGRGSSPDDSPKKTRVGGCVGAENKDDDAGGREAPVPRPVPAAGAVAAASAKADAKAEACSAATKWLKKGKWIAPKQGSPAVVAPQPPAKKFMHDGIRSFAPSNERRRHAAEALAAAAAAGDEKKRSRSDGVPRPDADDLGEPLRRRLAELGATRPRFVYRKALQKSDVCTNQNRLLVSCKRETGLEGCPITACFSPREWQRVRNKDVGLVVTALDRDGVAQTLTCKFLQSNGGYRFISGWKDFLKRNGMELDSRGRWTRDVDVELRAFRSRALKRQPPVDENGKLVRAIGDGGMPDKERQQQLQVPDHFHPDGSLGLVLLHHEHRRRAVDRDDDDDFQGTGPSLPVASKKPKKQRVKPDAPAQTAASSPAARAGAAAEPGESAPPETMSKVEMTDKYGEPISSAMIGLIMLRGVSSEERRTSRQAPSRWRSRTTPTARADMALD
ncbi:hypothetical protein PAHAL_5G248600 [Panicum hallii]|jgi:hypothetical protein|uniref:TF-B3 domain-containing protein n=1 Tax=Panicum hallii TaxID=206008 RepID=A0A2S3HU12_9POAL|nr:hypothetical protein PAHAL_5G248600 [Panicum hallii]